MSLAILLATWIVYRGYRIATTRSHSPAETINFDYKDLAINVTYCRPYKKGREIFGEARDRKWLPEGKFWTLGFRALTGLPLPPGHWFLMENIGGWAPTMLQKSASAKM